MKTNEKEKHKGGGDINKRGGSSTTGFVEKAAGVDRAEGVQTGIDK